MYSDLWSPKLRQGDVLGPMQVPLIGNAPQVVAPLPTFGSEEAGAPSQMLLPTSLRYMVVVSHDCEFNDGKRDRILLARVHAAHGKPGEIDYDAFRASNDIEARVKADRPVDVTDSFLIDPLPGHFEEPQLVVFTTITPYPAKKMLLPLQGLKLAELEHDERLLLRRKLAWFFLRSPEDIPAEEKRPADEVRAEVENRIGK